MESAKFFDYIPTTMSDILHSSSSPGLFDEAPFVVGIGSLKEFQEAQALLSNLTYTNESVLWDPFEMARNECSSSLNCLAVDSSDSILVGATNLEYGTAAAAEGSTFYPHRPNYSFNYCTELGDSSSISSADDFSNSFVSEYYWTNSSMPLLLNTDLSSENPSMTIPCNDLASFPPHDVCLALNEDNIDVISRQSVNSWEMSTTGHDIDQKRKMVVDRDILDLEPSSHRKRLCTGEQSVGILSKKCIAGEVADTNDNSSELNEGSSDHGGLVSSKSVLNGMASIAVGSTLNTNGKPGARKCSASDPQSLYARNRREKINERLKILQNLVPNGTKVDISTMLEQAIDYVKFMQLQIKLLSSDEHWMYTPIAFNAGLDVEAALGFNSTI